MDKRGECRDCGGWSEAGHERCPPCELRRDRDRYRAMAVELRRALKAREEWLNSDMIKGVFVMSALHGGTGDGGEWARKVQPLVDAALASSSSLDDGEGDGG